jgi:hypothetical protein
MRICLNGCSGILTVDKCRFRTEKYGSQWMGNAPKPGFTHDYCSCGGNFLWITGCRKTTGNVIHMTLPAGLYYSQNKKINFGTFHNGLIGGVNCNEMSCFFHEKIISILIPCPFLHIIEIGRNACRSSRPEYDERVCLTSGSDGVLLSVEYRLRVRRD